MASPSLGALIRYLQRKRYQYEVTFSLYMLTPTEKFIFNSFLFLFLSMIIVAASMYLPEHVSTIAKRAWWYYAGEEAGATPPAMVDDHIMGHAQGRGMDGWEVRGHDGYGGGL